MGTDVLMTIDTGVPTVAAVFSTRVLDVRLDPSRPEEETRVDRRRLAASAGFDPSRAVALRQVHGAEVVVVGPAGGRGSFTGDLRPMGEADASVTAAPEVALLALGADCLPVLLWDADGGAVAAVHAGWRGLVAGVVDRAVDALATPTERLRAAVGPGIGPCCYPVDARLRSAMGSRFGSDVVVGEAVDLGLAATRALVGAGLSRDGISSRPACTSCEADRFFSYRREGEGTGRQAGVIWIREPGGTG